MSHPATNQEQSNAEKDTAQSTAETATTNDALNTENGTDSGASQARLQETGPGPKVLRSHYRGMPNQWEKNLHPKKDSE